MTDDESWRNELTKAGVPRKRPKYRVSPRWEPKKVELVPHFIPKDEYDLRMSLLVEALYEELQRETSK